LLRGLLAHQPKRREFRAIFNGLMMEVGICL